MPFVGREPQLPAWEFRLVCRAVSTRTKSSRAEIDLDAIREFLKARYNGFDLGGSEAAPTFGHHHSV